MRQSYGVAIATLIVTLGSACGEIAAAQDDTELSRSERRELRRAEREAERAAAAQSAAAARTEAAAEEASEEGDDEGIICRRESVTGTHQRVRICTTAAEREAARQSAREVLQDVSRSRGVLSPEGQ